jgi:DNA-binding MarR family transcriptional regulator
MRANNGKNATTANGRAGESAFRAFLRVFGLVERAMQDHFGRFGISGAQWGVLRLLYRAEEEGLSGLRLTDLSDRLLIRPPSATGVVARLERAGLVERHGSPADLRAKPVGLTAKGRQLIERILPAHEARIEAVLSGLSHAEQNELRRLLERLGQHLETLNEQTVAARLA